jgi:hypothetical protein
MVNSVSALLFGEVKSSMMKSKEYSGIEISDTLAYVFNFGDSSGYAIISKDSRVESPLLAITEKGSLVNGKTDNPGLKIFLKRLEGYMLESIAKYGKEGGLEAVAKEGPVDIGPNDTLIRPLVSVEWGQDEPFNNNLKHDNCGTTSNGRVWAGCVATAVAQIMSYWEHPAGYDWILLNKYKHKKDFEINSATDSKDEMKEKVKTGVKVAILFQNIGTGVKMNYDCNGSGTSSAKALSYLVSKGFSSETLAPYSIKPFIKEFAKYIVSPSSKRRPFMARGCNLGGGCHAWIIDGIAQKADSYYVHNNWGWDGTDNGYFPSGVFDPLTRNYQDVEIAKVYR